MRKSQKVYPIALICIQVYLVKIKIQYNIYREKSKVTKQQPTLLEERRRRGSGFPNLSSLDCLPATS
jgi:hypothetical protein